MTTETHPLADAYLRRLEGDGAHLDAARRAELVAEIREHISEAVSARVASGQPEEVAIREVLDRLGPPEDIVRAASDELPAAAQSSPAAAPTSPSRGGLGATEFAALVLLPLGGFLFVVGWVVGVVLLWMSQRWTVGEKLLGTFVWPLGLLAPGGLVFLSYGTQSCSSSGTSSGGVERVCTGGSSWWSSALAVAVILAPIAVVVFLGYRGNRRARAT